MPNYTKDYHINEINRIAEMICDIRDNIRDSLITGANEDIAKQLDIVAGLMYNITDTMMLTDVKGRLPNHKDYDGNNIVKLKELIVKN